MKFVVDSNILFTFFWKNSVFESISLKQEFELVAPEYALEEINKYASEIKKRAKLTQEEFKKLKIELAIRVEFIPLNEYLSFFKNIQSLIKDLPEKERIELLGDIDFLALALKLNIPIWSNDKDLKNKQNRVRVYNTEEVLKIIS